MVSIEYFADKSLSLESLKLLDHFTHNEIQNHMKVIPIIENPTTTQRP
jgi:hypothetical protein